jgi:hypothetical protein
VTIEKGKPWGETKPLPPDGVVVPRDADLRALVERARHESRSVPTVGLLGGDLCRTVGCTRDEARLRGPEATTFPVDLGEVLLDGRLHFFVAHLVARDRFWRRAFIAMNAQWLGPLNLGPRAHPNDGLLDTYDVRLPLGGWLPVRRRARLGAHLPHPGIKERRAPAVQIELERALPVWLDGEPAGTVRAISVRVQPDALRVVA